ncbi:hypothetical protein DFH06DRAFT_1019248 [Mycena polygramma]|nr:hypothetical protein DFH06DRAFT_1019248 [Mycena polygramma]
MFIQDFPMQTFMMNHRDEYLDELCRLEGRGSPEFYEKCAECKRPDPSYRCAHGTCFSQGMYCQECIVKVHRQLPTHTLQEWKNGFFTPVTLEKMPTEVRYQLGHPPGSFCTKSHRAHTDFVVIDVLAIQIVKISFCECDSTITHRQQLL